MVVGGLVIVALPLVDGAKIVQRVGFTVAVADLAGKGEGLLKVVGSLPVVALLPVDVTEVEQRVGFGSGLVGVAGGVQRVGVDGQAFGKMAAGIEIAVKVARSVSSQARAVARSGIGGVGVAGRGMRGRRCCSAGIRVSIAAAAVAR